MKQINIYFGKQEETVLGNYADVVKIIIDDKEVDQVIDSITTKRTDWIKINIFNGHKFVNTNNILWFDVVEPSEERR